MTVISVGRNRIIKAIESEPFLEAKTWAKLKGTPRNLNWGTVADREKARKTRVSDTENCSVCAVGSVMRNCISKNQNWNKIEKASMHSISVMGNPPSVEPTVLVKEKHYMRGLSNFFESAWREEEYRFPYLSMNAEKIARVRAKTIQFVKDNFPTRIKIDIDGVKPAKDVTVVK